RPSAHASHEELFLVKQMSVGMKGDEGVGHVHVTWRKSQKQQPADTKFRVPAIDAPNVRGAQDLALTVPAAADGGPDLSGLRTVVDQGRIQVLYVLDPGPDGSLGDVSWVTEARKANRLRVVIYEGVQTTAPAKIAAG